MCTFLPYRFHHSRRTKYTYSINYSTPFSAKCLESINSPIIFSITTTSTICYWRLQPSSLRNANNNTRTMKCAGHLSSRTKKIRVWKHVPRYIHNFYRICTIYSIWPKTYDIHILWLWYTYSMPTQPPSVLVYLFCCCCCFCFILRIRIYILYYIYAKLLSEPGASFRFTAVAVAVAIAPPPAVSLACPIRFRATNKYCSIFTQMFLYKSATAAGLTRLCWPGPYASSFVFVFVVRPDHPHVISVVEINNLNTPM